MSWSYYEPCCGSAAVALALLGAKQSIMPYQGSKWRFRQDIIRVIREFGFSEWSPSTMELADVSPWGWVWETLLGERSDSRFPAVLAHLCEFEGQDPQEIFASLNRHPIPADMARYTAEFLFLQRLSFSGKAVGETAGLWLSPGFNRTSAYGTPATDRFGEIKPMVSSLIRSLERLRKNVDKSVAVTSSKCLAGGPYAPTHRTEEQPLVVYIDPPYHGATKYPNGHLDRWEVVRLAEAWREVAWVIISEAEPIRELVEKGWRTRQIGGRNSTGESPFKGKQSEWLTFAERRP